MNKEEKALKSAMEELESIANGAVPPELAIVEAKALLNLINKQQKELENNKKFKEDIVNLIMLWNKEKLPENNVVIETLKTIIHEFSRLENIEDEKIQVAVEFIEEKRDKYWEDKIRQIISKYVDIEEHINYTSQELYGEDLKNMIIELLEENNND